MHAPDGGRGNEEDDGHHLKRKREDEEGSTPNGGEGKKEKGKEKETSTPEEMAVVQGQLEAAGGKGRKRSFGSMDGKTPQQHDKATAEMFSSVCNKVKELEHSIEEFHQFLKTQEMYPYFNSLLLQFFQLSDQVKARMNDIETLYSFLHGYQLSASSTSAGYFSVLPQELCLAILSYLDYQDLANISLLNRQWRSLTHDNMLWKTLCHRRWRGLLEPSKRKQESDGGTPKESSKKKTKTGWQEVFKTRLLIETNWKTGVCGLTEMVPKSEVGTPAFCLHFDEERLVTATDSIEVLDAKTGDCIRTMRGHTDSVMCLDFDKKWIVSGSKDNTIRVWDAESGATQHVLVGHINGVRTLRFDDKNIVSGSRDATIKVWDLQAGMEAPVRTLAGHAYTVYCLEFDKRFIISGSVDKTIRIWEASTGNAVGQLKGHNNSIRCLKFDNTRIVSGAWDNHIKLWDLETHKMIHTFKGHTDRVMCLQFDEQKIVSGSVDKTIRIWDLRTDDTPIVLKGHKSCVYDLHFDEFKIVSASKDRVLLTWDFTAPRPPKQAGDYSGADSETRTSGSTSERRRRNVTEGDAEGDADGDQEEGRDRLRYRGRVRDPGRDELHGPPQALRMEGLPMEGGVGFGIGAPYYPLLFPPSAAYASLLESWANSDERLRTPHLFFGALAGPPLSAPPFAPVVGPSSVPIRSLAPTDEGIGQQTEAEAGGEGEGEGETAADRDPDPEAAEAEAEAEDDGSSEGGDGKGSHSDVPKREPVPSSLPGLVADDEEEPLSSRERPGVLVGPFPLFPGAAPVSGSESERGASSAFAPPTKRKDESRDGEDG